MGAILGRVLKRCFLIIEFLGKGVLNEGYGFYLVLFLVGLISGNEGQLVKGSKIVFRGFFL